MRDVSARSYGKKIHPKKTVDATTHQPSSIAEIGANSACSNTDVLLHVSKILRTANNFFKDKNVMKFLEIFEII